MTPNRTRAEKIVHTYLGLWNETPTKEALAKEIEQALDEAVRDVYDEWVRSKAKADLILSERWKKEGRLAGLETGAGIADIMALYAGPDIADAIRAKAKELGGK